MTENELILLDRIGVIRDTIKKYGEENFYLSFSGGKDSTILHYLLDMAIPGNKIPRVYADTGIDLNMVREFVSELAASDDRIVMIKPSVPIKQSLEEEGYPFKSKKHSRWLEYYQRKGMQQSVKNYLGEGDKSLYQPCPKSLKYQFSPDFKLKVSDHCCINMKEKPLEKWSKENNRPYSIVGIMRAEGGRRMTASCLAFKGKKLWHFQPLAVVTKEFEDWLIEEKNIKLCPIYKEPYNFERTGCKGCPFALHLQHELDVLQRFFPNERKQCEAIWKPVYDEYRRLGYRLDKAEQMKLL